MKKRRSRWTGLLLTACAVCAVAAGCAEPDMETRTFRLQQLDAHDAAQLLEPYVTAVEGGTMSIGGDIGTLTVHQTPAALDRIEEVLAEYDRPDVSLTLRFHVIEADGFDTDEEALADVLPALRDVLGFEGYRSLGEAQALVSSYGNVRQTIATREDRFTIECSVGKLRIAEDAGSVELDVELVNQYGREVLATSVTVPIGRTVVLGTSKPSPQRGAYILTVEPTYGQHVSQQTQRSH